jgi:hypothetical protein
MVEAEHVTGLMERARRMSIAEPRRLPRYESHANAVLNTMSASTNLLLLVLLQLVVTARTVSPNDLPNTVFEKMTLFTELASPIGAVDPRPP